MKRPTIRILLRIYSCLDFEFNEFNEFNILVPSLQNKYTRFLFFETLF